MDILKTIEFILKTHDKAGFLHGFYYERIGRMLKVHGITMPWYLVRDIIDTLHHHPPCLLEDGPIYGVEWAMRGYRIIIENYDEGETRENICKLLKALDYDWHDEFVRQVILAHGCWLENSNDVPSW